MIRGKGTGFVKLEGREEDVVIEKENLGFALDGDTVEIKLLTLVAGKRQEATVVNVIERSFRELIGSVLSFGNADRRRPRTKGAAVSTDDR